MRKQQEMRGVDWGYRKGGDHLTKDVSIKIELSAVRNKGQF